MTDGARSTSIDRRRLARLPVIEPARPPAPAPAAAGRPSRARAALLGLGWPVVLAVCVALEPVPDGAHAHASSAASLAVDLLALPVLLLAMLGAASAALRRSPTTGRWALAAGAVVIALTVACPASGHHAVGTWWYGQLAVCGAMLAATLRSSR